MVIFKTGLMNRLFKIAALLLIVVLGAGCVYYNTFYHARKAFNEAESKRREASASGSRARSGTGDYRRALEKAEKVIEKWPDSKWYDDALFISGVSSYYTEDYGLAAKRFRELLANYPESKFYKKSRLYLAKSRLHLDDEATAMTLFEELFTEGEDREIKAEAALALGDYHYENKQYEQAEVYYHTLIDSLGDESNRIVAKMNIADSYFERFRYKEALDNYLEVLDYELSSSEEYKIRHSIGECYYFLNDLQTGMEYFYELADNELYYDSLPSLKLMIAQGYDWSGDLPLAEDVYEEIAIEYPRHQAGTLANYYLGLIYQYEHEDYQKAKEYYDKAQATGAGTDIRRDALERSSNIGKLEEYRELKNLEQDSTTTLEEIDAAAETQYLLGELYLVQLGKPDSALNEFQYISGNFPEAYMAPKARIAVAVMKRDYYDDTLAFDSILRNVIEDYPRSDYIPEVIDLLGLSGTSADTGYARYYYRRAERFLFEEDNLDSARYYYSLVADSFPRSRYNTKAKFATLYITETYESPGDSSLYYAYANFADSFPGTEYGQEASRKLVVKPRLRQEADEGAWDSLMAADTLFGDTAQLADTGQADQFDTGVSLDPKERYYMGPGGYSIFDIEQTPRQEDYEFRYPIEAYSLRFEGILYFQIKINAFGEVDSLRLMNPTPSEEMNREAEETVRQSYFDANRIPFDLRDEWFVFKFRVELPSSLR